MSARTRSVWCPSGESQPASRHATHVDHFGRVALAQVVHDAGLVQKGKVCNVLDAVELWMRVGGRRVRRSWELVQERRHVSQAQMGMASDYATGQQEGKEVKAAPLEDSSLRDPRRVLCVSVVRGRLPWKGISQRLLACPSLSQLLADTHPVVQAGHCGHGG